MNHVTTPTPDRTARSRAEALRRSLLAVEAVPDEAQVVAVRAGQWSASLQPGNAFESWLVEQVADLSFRVDRCGRSERRLRDRASLRAEVCWGDDHRSQAEVIGGQLAARPAESVDRLRGTAAGCDWMIRRWALLARVADQGPWTADQVRLAFDLLATPAEFRQGQPGEAIDDQGRVMDPAESPAAVARREIAGLAERRDRLAGSEEVDRALVVAGLFDNACPEIRRLRRHEAALQRRIAWCLAQLGRGLTRAGARPGRNPEPPPFAEPPDPAGPSWPTDLDLDLDEFPGADIDPIALGESRREIREQVAQFRRQFGQPGA